MMPDSAQILLDYITFQSFHQASDQVGLGSLLISGWGNDYAPYMDKGTPGWRPGKFLLGGSKIDLHPKEFPGLGVLWAWFCS